MSITANEIEIIQRLARRHQGGKLAAYHRMMRRNSYSTDPSRPEPDDGDRAREELREKARELAREYAGRTAELFGVSVESELHRLQVRGWLV